MCFPRQPPLAHHYYSIHNVLTCINFVLELFEIMRIFLTIFFISIVDGFDFQGPQPDYLLGYWPFDIESGVDAIASRRGGSISPLGDLVLRSNVAEIIENNPLGPFGSSNSCISTTNASHYFIRYPKALFPKSFTISFYFYSGFKRDNSNYKRILKFGEGRGRQFAIGYMGLFLFLDLPYVKASDSNATPYWTAFATNRWSFVAITYDYDDNKISVFDSSGMKLQSAELPKRIPAWLRGLAIGSIEKLDRISCLQIYSTPLSGREIAK